jgi:hypothetical protein
LLLFCLHGYRPYLQFMYLNNAYRFYSPQPGPSTLLWFCIEYESNPDGSRNLRWVEVPAMDKDGNHIRPDDSPLWPNLEFTRRLSLAESTSFPGPSLFARPDIMETLVVLREEEAARKHLPLLREIQRPLDGQYREPNDLGKQWISLYARHVAYTFPHQSKPHLEVTGVKVYKVFHELITPPQMVVGMEPDDPTLYLPYYMGEFDKEGTMKPSCQTLEWDPKREMWDVARDEKGRLLREGFLYWWLPIYRPANPDPSQPSSFQQRPINCVLKHAGDVDGGDLP